MIGRGWREVEREWFPGQKLMVAVFNLGEALVAIELADTTMCTFIFPNEKRD